MTLMFKLIWRDLRANPGRMAVSVFAILVSVSLIVWMMGSYDTLVREFDNDAEAYMGNYDLCLVPESPKGPLPPGQYPQFRDPELPRPSGRLSPCGNGERRVPGAAPPNRLRK